MPEDDRAGLLVADDLTQFAIRDARIEHVCQVMRVGMDNQQVVGRFRPAGRRNPVAERQHRDKVHRVVTQVLDPVAKFLDRGRPFRRFDQVEVGVSLDREPTLLTNRVDDALRIRPNNAEVTGHDYIVEGSLLGDVLAHRLLRKTEAVDVRENSDAHAHLRKASEIQPSPRPAVQADPAILSSLPIATPQFDGDCAEGHDQRNGQVRCKYERRCLPRP